MIRILIDELGTGHDDIILKIDAMPSFAQFGDLYYMADFLQSDSDKTNKSPGELGIAYINYFIEKISKVNNSEEFIIFDISDQYIGGLLIAKGKKGLIKTVYATTDKIHGYEIDNVIIDNLINERRPVFNKQREWLLNEFSILEGLNWSLDKLLKKGS